MYNIRENEERGFVWMRRAMKLMDNFSENRNLYPYIEDFMPQIITFINSCGDNIEQIVFEYNHSNPYIVNVFPGLNTVVSSNIKEIRVNFSCPMHNSYGIFDSKQPDVVFPKTHGLGIGKGWNEDRTTFIIPVELEKGKNYGLRLPAGVFQSFETFPMKEDFEVLFKTAE
jgi:hypothetical protein